MANIAKTEAHGGAGSNRVQPLENPVGMAGHYPTTGPVPTQVRQLAGRSIYERKTELFILPYVSICIYNSLCKGTKRSATILQY